MATQDQLAGVMRALAAAWEKGCPVAHPGNWDKLARVAVRRCASIANRGVDPADLPGRVRDLAKGMVASFDRDPHPSNIGPLMVDYEYVAALIIDRLDGADP